MRSLIVFLLMTLTSFSYAGVGKILKLSGPKDAYLMRGGNKLPLALDMNLELNDQLVSSESLVLIQIYPMTQVSLSKNSEVKLSEFLVDEKRSSSVVQFNKGLIRLQVLKEKGFEIEQKVQAEGVAFDVKGTEFEVSLDDEENVDLDVVSGEVVVSSPYVQTFVPEIVKAREGFRFETKKKGFLRRKFSAKMKDPGFEKREKVQKRWKRSRT